MAVHLATDIIILIANCLIALLYWLAAPWNPLSNSFPGDHFTAKFQYLRVTVIFLSLHYN